LEVAERSTYASRFPSGVKELGHWLLELWGNGSGLPDPSVRITDMPAQKPISIGDKLGP
jgi:hypothetical protein